jgi:hypothetical protein
MSGKKFTLEQIREMHARYQRTYVLSVLKGGKWVHTVLDGRQLPAIDGVQAKRQPLKNVMPFDKYMEAYGA